MSDKTASFEIIDFNNRGSWREWLAQNHDSSPGIWLIMYKKNSQQQNLTYNEAVEEALSFGWIDSKPNVIDADRYKLLFVPRKPKSPWARSNKQRAAKLIRLGLMTPAGMAKIAAAKKDGSWYILDSVEALAVPEDLEKALSINKPARANYESYTDSGRKMILYFIAGARLPETRKKRIQQIIERLEKGVKQGHFFEK